MMGSPAMKWDESDVVRLRLAQRGSHTGGGGRCNVVMRAAPTCSNALMTSEADGRLSNASCSGSCPASACDGWLCALSLIGFDAASGKAASSSSVTASEAPPISAQCCRAMGATGAVGVRRNRPSISSGWSPRAAHERQLAHEIGPARALAKRTQEEADGVVGRSAAPAVASRHMQRELAEVVNLLAVRLRLGHARVPR